MSDEWTVECACGTTRDDFADRAEAEEGKQTHEALCQTCDDGDAVIHPPDGEAQPEPEPEADGGAEVVETPAETTTDELPDKPPVDTDPLTWIPDEFQDTIDGTVAINRKGFEVLAQHYGIATRTDMVVSPTETGGEVVVHKATAETDDGRVYTAYGEAHASEDDSHQLVRMSDTRAYKRAVSRATGVGMVAVEELKSELTGE